VLLYYILLALSFCCWSLAKNYLFITVTPTAKSQYPKAIPHGSGAIDQ